MGDRIFVTGASGFVGSAVCNELLRRGFGVNALVRANEDPPPSPLPAYQEGEMKITGDLFDAASLDAAMRDCSAVINLVGIIMEKPSKGITFERIHVEGTKYVLAAGRRAGIKRYIHMSALGARANAVSEYHKTKWCAEEGVRSSGLDWTIFRPSMIHGPRGEFMKMAAKWAKKQAMPFLFMPYFGRGLLGLGGSGLIQPVYVNDVSRAFVDAVEKPESIGNAYDLAGLDRMTWPEMLSIIARAVVKKKRLIIPIPAWYAKAVTHIAPAALLPFNHDQVIMSQEDNVADITPFIAQFGWTPAAFEPSLRSYASELSEARRYDER